MRSTAQTIAHTAAVRKELEERAGGYDWRTTEHGRLIAEAFVGE